MDLQIQSFNDSHTQFKKESIQRQNFKRLSQGKHKKLSKRGGQKVLSGVGFESPALVRVSELKSVALDHSVNMTYLLHFFYSSFAINYYFFT